MDADCLYAPKLNASSAALHSFTDKVQEQGGDGGADLAAGVGAAGPVDADLLGNIQLLLQLLSDCHRPILGLNDRHPAVLQQAGALSGQDSAEKDTKSWRMADCLYLCSITHVSKCSTPQLPVCAYQTTPRRKTQGRRAGVWHQDCIF